jgi:hypothetical protein
MTTKLIFLTEINFKDSPVVRVGLPNKEIVEQYAQNYTEKQEMPPIVVFYDEDTKQFYLADGRHRCAAIESLGRKAIMANLHQGSLMEALKFALLANSQHGLPRTQADKRRCIEAALKEWPTASNLHLATMTATSDKTVATVREEMEAAKKIVASPTRKSSSGATIAAKRTKADKDDEEPARVVAGEIAKDKLGRFIPLGVVKYWKRIPEVEEQLELISDVAGFLKCVRDEEDVMYEEVNFNGALANLDRVHDSLSTAIPYAVCTVCQGHPETQKNGCRMCMGRGLISKFRYDTIVTKETKNIVEKGKK